MSLKVLSTFQYFKLEIFSAIVFCIVKVFSCLNICAVVKNVLICLALAIALSKVPTDVDQMNNTQRAVYNVFYL